MVPCQCTPPRVLTGTNFHALVFMLNAAIYQTIIHILRRLQTAILTIYNYCMDIWISDVIEFQVCLKLSVVAEA